MTIENNETSSIIETDKSPKGSIDTRCLPFMDVLNQPGTGYETTSSCSGRIAIFAESLVFQEEGGQVVFPDLTEIKHHTDNTDHKSFERLQLVSLKFEPFILHVRAQNVVPKGRDLHTVAYNLGYRNSGLVLTRRSDSCMVAVRSTLKLDAPIGYFDPAAKCLHLIVTESYVRLLIEMSNEKFKKNFEKMDQLLKACKEHVSIKSSHV